MAIDLVNNFRSFALAGPPAVRHVDKRIDTTTRRYRFPIYFNTTETAAWIYIYLVYTASSLYLFTVSFPHLFPTPLP